MRYLLFGIALLYIRQGLAYKGAVVEYYPSQETTAEETIRTNLYSYRKHIENLKDQGVDIVVFPEYGLTTTVFVDPEDYAVELTNDTYVVEELTSMSAANQMYVVVNLLEKVTETDTKIKYYNTNLVFSRNGTIVAKYRKINLFQEPKLTPGTEVATFTTDFGVKFGLFTCFDILFYTPSRSILEDETVTDVVYPTAWVSTMPFYTSLTVQHGYATANGVNLLAANYENPQQSFGGGGIYMANGKIAEVYIDSTPSSKRLVQTIAQIDRRQKPTTCSTITPFGLPIPKDKPNITNFKTAKEFEASDYTFQDLDLSKETVSTTICHKDFCCNFNITDIEPANTNEYYKLMVYDGQVTNDDLDLYIRVCSLVACESDSKESCGARVNGTTRFTKITIDGMLDNDNVFYTPVTLNFDLKPIADSTYCETSNTSSQSHIQLSTTKSQKGVLVFGIVGRTNDTSSATTSKVFLFLLVLRVVVSKLNVF